MGPSGGIGNHIPPDFFAFSKEFGRDMGVKASEIEDGYQLLGDLIARINNDSTFIVDSNNIFFNDIRALREKANADRNVRRYDTLSRLLGFGPVKKPADAFESMPVVGDAGPTQPPVRPQGEVTGQSSFTPSQPGQTFYTPQSRTGDRQMLETPQTETFVREGNVRTLPWRPDGSANSVAVGAYGQPTPIHNVVDKLNTEFGYQTPAPMNNQLQRPVLASYNPQTPGGVQNPAGRQFQIPDPSQQSVGGGPLGSGAPHQQSAGGVRLGSGPPLQHPQTPYRVAAGGGYSETAPVVEEQDTVGKKGKKRASSKQREKKESDDVCHQRGFFSGNDTINSGGGGVKRSSEYVNIQCLTNDSTSFFTGYGLSLIHI